MAKTVELLNVFMASPPRLGDERKSFLKVIQKFNEDDAYERGFCFASRGLRSPTQRLKDGQAAINEQIRRSDYFILVLHDRWGTLTAGAASSTRKEYELALECLADPERPMQEVVILFKGVDQAQLLDPAEQLLEVLAFRSRAEANKSMSWTFDKPNEFRTRVRRQLHRWVRDREAGSVAAAASQVPPSPPASAEVKPDLPSAEDNVVKEARTQSKLGLHASAELLLAQQASENATSDANVEWVRVLRREGRTALAEETSAKLIQVSIDLGDHDQALSHYANLALSLRTRGEIELSLRTWQEAISYAKNLGTAYSERVAFLLDNLGLTARKAQNLDYARASIEEAIEIRRANKNRRGLAHSYDNLGLVERDSDDLEAAEAMHRAARRLFAKTGDGKDQAVAAVHLAAVLNQRGGDAKEVLELFEEALQLSKDYRDERGQAITRAQMARAFLEGGDVKSAEREADVSLMINEGLDDSVGIATSLELIARIREANDDADCALDLYDESFRLFDTAGHVLGATGLLLRIGNLHVVLKHLDQSADVLAQIRRRHGDEPPPRLRDEFNQLVAGVEQLRRDASEG